MQVDVQFACADIGVPDEQEIQGWVQHAVARSGRLPEGAFDIGVRIVGAAEIQSLNQQYRNKDGATNVLSFPAGAIQGLPSTETRNLGDIVICASVVRDEAVRQAKPLADHWAHMLVHGALHLLGFDHSGDRDAEEMESLEASILHARGVANPYASAP
ncbi:MAG: rRNA maturation RNase YbeY [Gammaproteobacteria bacterium]|nr:rRNA maturation RNase YbeY [Gammaproteobacteria bacterium]MDH5304608.1 rRNA maturation RNase YbeY [Gammaproteobacteria bacterium]MDH5322090.1 rRNA maturation RNase YbeY [Gammaproteobacteria bacterium]